MIYARVADAGLASDFSTRRPPLLLVCKVEPGRHHPNDQPVTPFCSGSHCLPDICACGASFDSHGDFILVWAITYLVQRHRRREQFPAVGPEVINGQSAGSYGEKSPRLPNGLRVPTVHPLKQPNNHLLSDVLDVDANSQGP